MNIIQAVLFALLGYLLGAVPVAVMIARSKGIDIFKFGSGNPGATNVKRACGKSAGNLCFFLDALKGFLAAFAPVVALKMGFQIEDLLIMQAIGMISAIVGHIFPVFMRFRGGKGVSVTIGGLVAIMWVAILIGLVIWVVAFYGTRYVSLASIFMASSLPISSAVIDGVHCTKFYLALFLALVVIFKHRSNIKRLLNGTENRFSKK